MKRSITKLLTLAGMIAVLALNISCGGDVKVGGIKGKVVLDETATGNAGFLVTVDELNYTAVTNDDGSFAFDSLPVTAKDAGYSISVTYGSFKKVVKEAVAVVKDEATDVGTIAFRSAQIQNPEYNWLGDAEDGDDFENPVKNDAYYNTTNENSYVYNGLNWDRIYLKNDVKSFGYEQRDDGIRFYGNVSGNDYRNYSEYSVNIRNITTDVSMSEDYEIYYDNWSQWSMTYPLVEAGKEYDFEVTVSWHNYTYSREKVTIKAKGGLGEFTIVNKDAYSIQMSDDKVISHTKTPEFTKNDNINVLNYGYNYEIYRTNDKDPANYYDGGNWLYAFTMWDKDLSNNTFDMHNMNNISNWQTLEKMNRWLNGSICGVRVYTVCQIAGYTNNGAVVFHFNDTKYCYKDWEGKRNKVLVTYGIANGKGDLCYDYVKEEENEAGDKFKTVIENLPGKEIEFTNANGEKVKAYGELYDFGLSVSAPTAMPTCTMTKTPKDKDTINLADYGYDFQFTGWNRNFDFYAESDDKVKIGDEEVYIIEVCANFKKEINTTVKAMMNDGTDKLYKEVYYNSDAFYYNSLNDFENYIENPTREGYTFIGWTYTKDGKEPEEEIKVNPSVTIYAQWSKNYKVTVKDGKTVIATLEACADKACEYGVIDVKDKVVLGLYKDPEFENEWDGTAKKDINVYAKTVAAKMIWSGNSSDAKIEKSSAYKLEVGDTLYFAVKNISNNDYSCEVQLRDLDSYYGYRYTVNKYIGANDKGMVSYSFTSGDTDRLEKMNETGLSMRTYNSSYFRITAVYLVKAE